MNGAVIAALLTASAALLASIVSLVAQWRTATLQHRFTVQREAANRAEEVQRVMLKYRQPLLYAAADLQSRLYNIVRGNLLQIYGRGTDAEKDYTTVSTLFVFGQYFGWVEALRRGVQFLDMGNDEETQRVQKCIEQITKEFSRDDVEAEFRLFRAQQRALGEIMLVPRPQNDGTECVGVASFTSRLADSEFARWFDKLRLDIDCLSQQACVSSQRIVSIQGTLIDLMDCLDQPMVYIPGNRRERLSQQSKRAIPSA